MAFRNNTRGQESSFAPNKGTGGLAQKARATARKKKRNSAIPPKTMKPPEIRHKPVSKIKGIGSSGKRLDWCDYDAAGNCLGLKKEYRS